MMNRIQGINGRHLPWDHILKPEVRRKLGSIQPDLLSLLQRDPDKRATLADFCAGCERTLGGITTVDPQTTCVHVRSSACIYRCSD